MNLKKQMVIGVSMFVSVSSAIGYETYQNPTGNNILSVFNGWTQIAGDEGHIDFGGGQDFDSEYLFTKVEGTQLSIGLQTGFDILDGHVNYYGTDYYAGDIALNIQPSNSIVNNGTSYQYALDFGLLTKNGYGQKVSDDSNWFFGDSGVDDAGLYEVTEWDKGVANYYNTRPVFAMTEGNNTGIAVDFSAKGYEANNGANNGGSYYRIATFDISSIIGNADSFTVDASWVMSCGNDVINGSGSLVASNTSTTKPIPEPSILALMGIGSISVLMIGMRRKN